MGRIFLCMYTTVNTSTSALALSSAAEFLTIILLFNSINKYIYNCACAWSVQVEWTHHLHMHTHTPAQPHTYFVHQLPVYACAVPACWCLVVVASILPIWFSSILCVLRYCTFRIVLKHGACPVAFQLQLQKHWAAHSGLYVEYLLCGLPVNTCRFVAVYLFHYFSYYFD